MSGSSNRNFESCSRGVAFLELAIVFPLVFLLFASTIELSRGMGARNQGELLAQETAVALFHECKDFDRSDSREFTADKANACLAAEIEAIHWAFRRESPNSAVIATIYQNVGGGAVMLGAPSISCYASTPPPPGFDCAAVATRFSEARATAELGALLANTDWVVVVETFVKTDGVIESILRPLGLEQTTYYSVALQ